jgi:hypothetical protein
VLKSPRESKQGAAEIFFHHRSQYEAEKQGRRLAPQLKEQVANDAKARP